MKASVMILLAVLCSNLSNSVQASTQKCRSYIPSSTPSEAFSPHADGTVTHKLTGLMWMRCSLGQHWDGNTCKGRAQTYSWHTAANEATTNQYAGFTDWRLPTREELEGIVEQSCETPAINTEVFPATPSNWYWSGTMSGRNDSASNLAWYVSFSLGRVHNQQKTLFGRVRLVRRGGE
ncbi:MAG TPA: DUF1566 domain-containing protein [Cellvibrionaceae bacterium]